MVLWKPCELRGRIPHLPNPVRLLEAANDEDPAQGIEHGVFVIAPARNGVPLASHGGAAGHAEQRVVFVPKRVGFRLF